MEWKKVATLDRETLIISFQLDAIPEEARIVAKYKEEDGIILLDTQETIIEMIDDTVPEDAEFDIWLPIEEEDDNEPRCLS